MDGSRVEAVRWQLAIEKYIKECGYKIGTDLAFSGKVHDKESGPEVWTWRRELSPGSSRRRSHVLSGKVWEPNFTSAVPSNAIHAPKPQQPAARR